MGKDMPKNKKLFGSILIMVCLGLVMGSFFGCQSKRTGDVLSELKQELSGIDLSLSPLDSPDLPEMDLQIPFDFSGMDFYFDIPDLHSEEAVDIGTPSVNVPTPTLSPTDIQELMQSAAGQ